MHRNPRSPITRRIIAAYDDWIIRTYCTIRFRIINLRMLEEIEQYMPRKGTILDLGCGFGLFSHYFALCSRSRRMLSMDLNARRIGLANKAAERLDTARQTDFRAMNVLDYPFDRPVDGIVMLDLVHHLPKGKADGILLHCHRILADGGVLLIKDVEDRPWWKMAFTWILDKAMDYRTPVNYYPRGKLVALLRRTGFDVHSHQMLDILPYPHIFYICRKRRPRTAQSRSRAAESSSQASA